MSETSDKKTAPAAGSQPQATTQAGTQTVIPATQSDNNAPAETPLPAGFSVEMFQQMLNQGISQGVTAALAQRDAEEAERKTAEEAAAKQKAEAEKVAATPVAVDTTGPLYGNKDRKKEFDLRKMTNLIALPADKVVIALPKYNRDSEGNAIGLDLKNTLIQYVDPTDHKNRSTTDSKTGSTTYQMLSVDPVVLHEPK